MRGDAEGILRDIDAEVERELGDQERELDRAGADAAQRVVPPAGRPLTDLDAIWNQTRDVQHVVEQVLAEVNATQRQMDALHDAWLAQARLLKRSTFPTRWVIVILVAMILTWVFSRFQLNWS